VNNAKVITYEEKYNYIVSFLLSFVILAFVLFYTPSVEIADTQNLEQRLQIINIDQLASPKRVTKKEISHEKGESASEATVERARGTSLDAKAVDIAFYPNIAPPRPLSKFKRLYPKIAREQNVEAVLNTVLLISDEGKVLSVNVVAVRLSKSLPPELYSMLSIAFSKDAVKILLGAQFTPPIVEGKRVPIKMELPLRFKLNV